MTQWGRRICLLIIFPFFTNLSGHESLRHRAALVAVGLRQSDRFLCGLLEWTEGDYLEGRKTRINHHFSTSLKEINGVEGLATSQKASGRCWLFAMLNTLRYPIIQQLDLAPDFELSQSHLFYWDKVERANFFLETIIETADELIILGDALGQVGVHKPSRAQIRSMMVLTP